MKTRGEIVAAAKALNFLDGNGYELFDARLYERAQALKGKPECSIEWLLGCALDECRDAARATESASIEHQGYAIALRECIGSDHALQLSSHTGIDMHVSSARYWFARKMLARVLETYDAMAVEVVT